MRYYLNSFNRYERRNFKHVATAQEDKCYVKHIDMQSRKCELLDAKVFILAYWATFFL